MTDTQECTGLSASWCPIHGDCTCPEPGDGEAKALDDFNCSLHSLGSDHRETPSPTEQSTSFTDRSSDV